jgi:hypothetical protein
MTDRFKTLRMTDLPPRMLSESLKIQGIIPEHLLSGNIFDAIYVSSRDSRTHRRLLPL